MLPPQKKIQGKSDHGSITDHSSSIWSRPQWLQDSLSCQQNIRTLWNAIKKHLISFDTHLHFVLERGNNKKHVYWHLIPHFLFGKRLKKHHLRPFAFDVFHATWGVSRDTLLTFTAGYFRISNHHSNEAALINHLRPSAKSDARNNVTMRPSPVYIELSCMVQTIERNSRSHDSNKRTIPSWN